MAFTSLNTIPPQEPLPGYHVKFIHSKNMTFAHWDVLQGAPLPAHSHPHEQVTTIIGGKFELTVGGQTKVLRKGDVAVIPPNVTHCGKAITDCHIIDVFYPIREDYLAVRECPID